MRDGLAVVDVRTNVEQLCENTGVFGSSATVSARDFVAAKLWSYRDLRL